MMLMLNVPATLGLIVLATPIVRLLFERGHFLPADTVATASALRLYALGLVGYSTVRIVSPTFYALGRSRIPVIISVSTIILNALLSVALVHTLGFRGLALATSIAALVNGALLVWRLHREANGIAAARLVIALTKTVAAGLAMVVVAASVDTLTQIVFPGGRASAQTSRLACTIVSALIALAASAKLLRIGEFDDVMAALLRRAR
jgi:putative peptidoglycan lipid II flippase